MTDLESDYERGSGANPAVDSAAWTILGPALRGEPSPILRTSATWTLENARALRELITGDNADTGPRKFVSKLNDQLAGAPSSVVVLAAELLCVQVLPLSNITPETKRTRVNTVLSWVNPPLSLPSVVDEALGAGGTFHGGAGFTSAFGSKSCGSPCSSRSGGAPRRTSASERCVTRGRSVTSQIVCRVGGSPPCGHHFSRWCGRDTSTASSKMRIEGEFERRSFTISIRPALGGDGDLDYDLWRIRESIQEPGRPRVDWYASPYFETWASAQTQGKAIGGQRAWLVRPGQGGGNLVDGWRAESFVSLPATNLRLDLDAATESSIREAVETGYTHLDYAQRLQLIQADQAFILRMAPEDIILTVSGDSAWIGSVAGDPSWSDSEGSRLRRAVLWLPEAIARRICPNLFRGCWTSRAMSST